MATTYSRPSVPRPEPPPRQRTALTVTGILMAFVGMIAGTAAAAVIVAFGSSGTLDSGSNEVSSSTAALVTEVATMADVHGIAGVTGRPTLRMSATSTGGSGVFIGIGPADAVADYLSGVAFDRVTDFSVSPFDLSVSRQPGGPGASPPGEQDFWVASATSQSTADLAWPIEDGDHRLVLMNADGTPGVISLAQVQLDLPNAFPVSLTALIGSGVLVAAGVALVAVAVTRRRARTDQPPAGRPTAE
jgi:hypothetical protein